MIQLRNVTKKYGKKTVLDDVTINFKTGRVSCLLGINGVGKSTTMKAITKLIPINSGEILVDGERISEKNIDKIAYIADIPTFDIGCTIKECFKTSEVFYKNWDMEKAYKLLEFFNLTDDRKLKELSKGNLARVNLILGLSQNTPYLLMDEPFSGIDIFSREEFIAALKTDYVTKDQTIIITTHEIDEIECIAEDIILLEDGVVVKTFTKEEADAEGLTVVETMRRIYRGSK